jgi:hypothetical protein
MVGIYDCDARELEGAVMTVTPAQGTLRYPDYDTSSFDPAVTATTRSGAAVLYNVASGDLSAAITLQASGAEITRFTVSVAADAVTNVSTFRD